MSDEPSNQADLERREHEARWLARRDRRRDRRRYVFGKAMVWAATIVFAFGVGYSQNHRLVGSAAFVEVGVVSGLGLGGGVLMGANILGAAMWIEDPEAAKRWRDDLERERRRY